MIGKMPYDVLMHPFVTEKTLNFMENQNALMFVVRDDSTKEQVKRAFEKLFEVKVEEVNIRNTRSGKQAIIKLTKDFKAEEIGMRIGIF